MTYSTALYHFAGPGEFVCEPDEYAALVVELRKSGIIKDHRKGFQLHKNSFTGKDFVDWLVKLKETGMTYLNEALKRTN